MTIRSVTVAAALAVTLGAAGAAVAADQTGPAATKADKDLGKLSIDGAGAYQDIGLARLAIYDGKPDMAVKLVDEATASLSRAKTDDSVFMKAEADLNPPKTAAASTPRTTEPSKAAVAWVPVDGAFILDETLTPSPAKTAAVNEANKHLRNGEPDKAKETLKVAAVDSDYVMTLLPLQQTMQDVQEASQMLAQHKYYDASQDLRKRANGGALRHGRVPAYAAFRRQGHADRGAQGLMGSPPRLCRGGHSRCLRAIAYECSQRIIVIFFRKRNVG